MSKKRRPPQRPAPKPIRKPKPEPAENREDDYFDNEPYDDYEYDDMPANVEYAGSLIGGSAQEARREAANRDESADGYSDRVRRAASRLFESANGQERPDEPPVEPPTPTVDFESIIKRSEPRIPKPAVKVTAPIPPISLKSSETINKDPREVPHDETDDEIDSFRQQYKGRERVPAPREALPVRRVAHGGGSERDTHDARDEKPGSGLGDDPPNPMNWLVAALAFAFFIALAVLVYRINIISGELKEAREQLVGTSYIGEADSSTLRLRNEALEEENLYLQGKVDELQNKLDLYQANPDYMDNTHDSDTTQVFAPHPSEPTPPPTPTTSQNAALPTIYTVVAGDNLTKIARHFYNDTKPETIEKIMKENGMKNDSLSIGQKLKIPQ